MADTPTRAPELPPIVNGPTAAPYVDARFLTYEPAKFRSLYHSPMRAWLETPDVMTLRACAGINLNIDGSATWDAAVKGLAAYGISKVRLTSMSWGNLDPATETFPGETELVRRLSVLAKLKIRPCVLLEINEANPAPNFGKQVWLSEPAQVGDTTVVLSPDQVKDLVPHRSGFSYINPQNYRMCEVLFTSIGTDGTVSLSLPLPVPLATNTPYNVHTFVYEPFYWKDADGNTAPPTLTTLAGYLKYVGYVCRLLRQGTIAGAPASGGNDWDLEFLNERFGESFLRASTYYAPDTDPTPVKALTLADVGAIVATCQQAGDFTRLPALFADRQAQYRGQGQAFTDDILRAVIALVNGSFPGAAVLDGYASQMPYIGGANNLPGIGGDTSHPYHNPEILASPPPGQWFPYTFLLPDGTPDGVKADPDNEEYVGIQLPRMGFNLPERELLRFDIESRVRDLSPIPTLFAGDLHGRNVPPRNGGTKPAHLVLTEFNLAPIGWKAGQWLPGISKAAQEYIHAKIALRTFTAYANKSAGTTPVYLYAMDTGVGGSDAWMSMFPSGWDGKANAPKMAAWRRSLSFVEREHGGSIKTPRPLTVKEISDTHNAKQWPDMDDRHPGKYCREDLVVLPFQQTDNAWAIALYLLTYNVGQVWTDGDTDLPATYTMPEMRFTIRLSEPNLKLPAGATLTLYDPMDDTRQAVSAVMDGGDVLVEVPVRDYPRWLVLAGK